MLSLLTRHRARAIQSLGFNPNHPRYNGQLHPLVGWWDFTDYDTLYTDAGTTKVSAQSDKIYRIDNKAIPNTRHFGVEHKLGLYLEQSSEPDRPTVRAITADPKGRGAVFNGIAQSIIASRSIGNANGTNSLADLDINLSKLTLFAAFAPDNSSLASTQNIFTFQDGAQSTGDLFLRHTDDQVVWNSKDNVARTNTYIDSGVDITAVPQLWTVQLNCDTGGSSSYLYKQGMQEGNTGGGDVHLLDMSLSDADIGVSIGSYLVANMSRTLFFDGTVFEILMYNGTLSDAAALEVQQYLITKYDLLIL